MEDHEVSDGTYPATVAAYQDGFVTFIAPACDPGLLVAPAETLPDTDISPDESLRVTITDETITALERTE